MPAIGRATVLLLVGALLPHPAAAQVRLALSAGLVSSTLAQDFGGSAREVERRGGPTVAVSVGWPLASGLWLVAEPGYTTRGGGDPASEATLRLRYLTLPMMLRYDLDFRRTAAPFVAAGVAAGYLAGCTLDDGAGFAEPCDEAYGRDGAFAAIDFGLAAAVGIRLGGFELAVRREVGLRDVDRAPGFTSRNRAWLVTLAVRI